jgi:hypothetical protein
MRVSIFLIVRGSRSLGSGRAYLAYSPAVPVDHSTAPDALSMTTLPSFCTSR